METTGISDSSVVNSPTTCKYFLQNSCRFGDFCKYPHVNPNVINTDDDIPPQITMTPIQTTEQSRTSAVPSIDPDIWIQAPEFVPNKKPSSSTFAQIVGKNYPNNYINNPVPAPTKKTIIDSASTSSSSIITPAFSSLCPYLLGSGICHYDPCDYVHGDLCELCQRNCLHPTDVDQQKAHNNECIAQHEKDMELSFAIQKSKDKTCGVCFEVIMEKPGREQRFGILPNCAHCFCLECIRKWRQAEQFDNKIKRACPECRITSDFVCPSTFWVDTKEEKDKLINEYKDAMQIKDCKYFNKGRGKCPFGNRCFYRHVDSNGVPVDVGVPPRPVRRQNQFGELEVLEDLHFWDFIIERNLLLDDVISFLSDSSNLSDYNLQA
uniref:RING-type E3 ubiquitin transferase n=1 Tax=Culicoides sonorensis TaxID=179676 RepID=A0A336MQK2_CULSO